MGLNPAGATGQGVGRLLATTVLTAGTSFAVGASTTSIFIRVQGGGGGGGGADTAAVSGGAGGGGSAGGYAEKLFAVTPSASYTYAVGAAGAAGTAGANNGGLGGDSTFAVGATTVTAKGGVGGIGGAAGTTINSTLGGASPVVATNGDVNSGGTPGGIGLRLTGLLAVSGSGGSCVFGAGGNGRNTQGDGAAGVGRGAGGGGGVCLNGGSAQAGGAGLAGQIVVTEYS